MHGRLKLKIFLGFMLLVALLMVAGAVSIIEFIGISRSVNSLIEDNYKTIIASKSMLEALEREDSGILLLLLGRWEEGRSILKTADINFDDALKIAQNNVTETNEDQYIQQIAQSYNNFKEEWKRPIVDTDKEGNINWYFQNTHKDFLEVKYAINRLMELNQTSMHNEASMLKDKSHRAIMPGIVALIAALVFSLLFNFFISKYFISPIDRLIKALNNFSVQTKTFDANIKTNDDLKKLETGIQQVIEKLTRNNK